MQYFDKPEMSTLVSCTNHLTKEGFTENFKVTKEGLVAPSTEKVYLPGDVKIESFYRFEGDSDPADNCILYAISANDGTRGMLIDAYGGPYVNQKVGKFIKDVEEIQKRPHSDVGPHCSSDGDICHEDPKKRIDENKKEEEGRSPDQNSNL
jgi:hypothetical protein